MIPNFSIADIFENSISQYFFHLLEEMINFFSGILSNVMGTSVAVLDMQLVQNATNYTQTLAFSILIVKVLNEAFQTYIMYESGDPDADPGGLLIRTVQATAVISSIPWIIRQVFEFGDKLINDVSNLGIGTIGVNNWDFIKALGTGKVSIIIIFVLISIVICFLLVAMQSAIRGAELALMSVLGSFMALNLTTSDKSMWKTWFRRLIIMCISQALQIFLIKGAIIVMSEQIIGVEEIQATPLFLTLGWLWVTFKSPKFVAEIIYSTGFSGAVSSGVKQQTSMYLMRKMMSK